MSDPAQHGGPAGAGTEEGAYSKDYWDLVADELGRRPLVRIALAVLALLYASAIYAPLVANDRPYVLDAVDRKAYDRARRGLVGVATSLRDLAAGGAADFAGGAGTRTYADALDAELAALALRLGTMRRYLPAERTAPLDAFEAVAGAVVELALAGEADAAARADELRTEARALRAAFEPQAEAEPSETGADGAGPVALVAAVSYPLAESTTALEVFFMVLWGFVLTWPLWNRLVDRRWLRGDRGRVRRARRTKLAVVLGSALASALVWQLAVGGVQRFDVSTVKDGLTAGHILPQRVVFPPLNLGFAETHLEESYRPPTWTAKSELDERGHYVRGPRVPEPDPVTGRIPGAQPVEVRYGEPPANGAWRHVLGTDKLGRDLFVRALYGGRISLAVGLLSTALLVAIGTAVGAVAGYAGGRVDLVLSRLIEVVQSVPAFFLIITAVALIPEKTLHPVLAIVVVIALVRWTGVARLVRAEFLKLKELDFVLAARALGLSRRRIVFRHVLPNALGPVLVAAAFSVAAGILTESSISFLGFGIQHPIPSWGSLINESRAVEHWWIQVFPGLLIFLTVFCTNLVGEGIRDALDPRGARGPRR